MTITFTLAVGSSGTAAGPFNISGTTDANVVSELATGITKSQLTAGYQIVGINNAITGGTIASTGTVCPSSTTTWSVIPPCECLSVTNEGSRSEIFQYNRCSDGQLVSLSAPNGEARTVCVQNGTDIIDTSGFLTSTSCGAPCTVNGDCADCV
jgi:hypothetical protein